MLDANLKKARKLRELEDKILDLSPDFDFKVFIQLYSDFFEGVKELKNQNLSIPSISHTATSAEEEELLEYLQYLLMEKDFHELSKKKIFIMLNNIRSNTPDFSFDRINTDLFEYLEEIYSNLNDAIRKDLEEFASITPDNEDFDVVDDITRDELYQWFNPYGYIEDLRQVGTLILKTDSLPEHFDRITSTIKESFAFQQYLAVAVMCRTALEITLRDLYKKLGFTKKRTPEHNIAKEHFDKIRRATGRTYPNQFNPEPRDLRQLICKLEEYQKYEEDLDKLYGDLSRVVHGTNIIRRDKAEEYIQETYWLIHEMYMELKSDCN